MAIPMLFAACDDDDDYGPRRPAWADGNDGNTSVLNQYEKQLVGSYVSDDDPASPFYLVLNDDRTGSFTSVSGGQESGDDFTWRASANELAVTYKSSRETDVMEYSFANNHLYVDGIPLVANSGTTTQETLVGQWQGAIKGYYKAVWGLTDSDFATVCEFDSNGYGCQLDYYKYSPISEYAYTPFSWTKTGNVITITYDPESKLSAARISDYALTSKSFTGKYVYGGQSFLFDYESVTGFDWKPYMDGGSQAKSPARVRAASLLREHSGVVLKGRFASGPQPVISTVGHD